MLSNFLKASLQIDFIESSQIVFSQAETWKNLSDYVSWIESLTKPIRRVIWDLNGYLNSNRCQFFERISMMKYWYLYELRGWRWYFIRKMWTEAKRIKSQNKTDFIFGYCSIIILSLHADRCNACCVLLLLLLLIWVGRSYCHACSQIFRLIVKIKVLFNDYARYRTLVIMYQKS